MGKFEEYIDEMVVQLQKEEQSLVSTDRKDESNLVKIQINVYGICKTIYQVFAKTKSGIGLKADYLQKLDNLSIGWNEAYEKAREHDDVEKSVVEEIKLQVLKDVRQKLLEIWEE